MIKINPTPFHLAQNIITGLAIILSIAILGTSAHTLNVFTKQQTSNPWWMPLWPQHYNTHGTKALIASSAITLVLCGAFFTALFVPQLVLRQKHTLRALLSLATLFPSLLLTLAATIYAHLLNKHVPDTDTIQTWTCKYQAAKSLPHNTAIPSGMGNGNFRRLCHESKFALWGTLTVFLLLCAGLGVTVVTWLADKVASRQRRKERLEMESVSK